jgi:uridylate kinase
MKKIVIKIGGSLFFTNDKEINLELLNKFLEIIKSKGTYETIVLVCGGGVLAREYIQKAKMVNANNSICDLLGIKIASINGDLLIAILGKSAYPQVPKDMKELSVALLNNKIIVMGGLQPGQSTTSVAIEVAEYIDADVLVILTDVDGIYDKNPKKYADAKFFQKMTFSMLRALILEKSDDDQAAAGEYRIFDAVSLQLLKRSHLKVIVMSGKDLTEFKNFWNGKQSIKATYLSD